MVLVSYHFEWVLSYEFMFQIDGHPSDTIPWRKHGGR
jgi:hypothetical protein